jgi:acyl-CoA synthetase (AMP-forming)/AMP-acid ligase II
MITTTTTEPEGEEENKTTTRTAATANIKTKAMEKMSTDEMYKLQAKQGKPIYGVELKIIDDDGKTLPEDGKAYGKLMIRGPQTNFVFDAVLLMFSVVAVLLLILLFC